MKIRIPVKITRITELRSNLSYPNSFVLRVLYCIWISEIVHGGGELK